MRTLTYNGETYNSLSEFCEKQGLPYKKFWKIYKEYGSIIEAMEQYRLTYKYTYEGKSYTSLKKLCVENQLNYNKFLKVYQETKSIDRAARQSQNSKIKKKPRKTIKYNGKTYRNMRELCKDLGLSYTLFRKYIQENMSIDRAVIKSKPWKIPITYKGTTYPTITDFCEAYSINVDRFRIKWQQGEDIETCMDYAQKDKVRESRPCIAIQYNGKEYRSLKQFCSNMKLSYQKMHKYIKQGKNIEDAIAHSKPKYISENGTELWSYREICQYYGISYSTFVKLNSQGRPIPEIIKQLNQSKRMPYLYNGKEYHSFYAFCESKKIPYNQALALKKKGFPPEEIIRRLVKN